MDISELYSSLGFGGAGVVAWAVGVTADWGTGFGASDFFSQPDKTMPTDIVKADMKTPYFFTIVHLSLMKEYRRAESV